MDDAIGIFVREALSLPRSFPFAVSRSLLGLNSFAVSTFNQQVKLFKRVESITGSLTFSALRIDRCFLLPHAMGVNVALVDSLRAFGLSGMEDYLDEEPLRVKIKAGALSEFRKRLFQSEAFTFWSQLEEEGSIVREFEQALNRLNFEHVRVLFCFLGNSLRWTALNVPSEYCPFCRQKFYSIHLFQCRQVTYLSLTNPRVFYSFIESKDYDGLIRFIFLTCRAWIGQNQSIWKYQFRWNIESFFDPQPVDDSNN